MSKLIIFTDLDGTLLNHHTYDYAAVCPILARLKAANIPVILNSSKTLAELEAWQSKLSLPLPLIAENGGVLQVLNNTGTGVNKILIGQPYAEIRSYIKHLRKHYHWQFEGFGDWTVSEVMGHTGLHSNDAVLAMEREVTEPILWQDSPENLELFKQALAAEHLVLKQGGRFYHVMGNHDKADAMHFLVNKEYFSCGQHCQTIALGDSENDLSMLNYADFAVVLPNASGRVLEVSNAIYASDPAPMGWVNAVESLLFSANAKAG
ncbi:HAD-IIB family hydrolase [Thiosulfativibrio zosterae]|uniref:Mannosyl-3-phosphoglycerate phosphatase n=1 Tax=Thiosulfativibrio zosterae TaxID=2675053 RepID=A0A6F8PNP2_9GAMM|nr:HAD-IIB family hydrolase [Thiosulfativibrio zosterae]BBP43715.1 mannosyl-3-phosphoglycerate phosphatase [Thiosulfativibrio zosterae]